MSLALQTFDIPIVPAPAGAPTVRAAQPAAGWQPRELGLGRACAAATALVLALLGLFIGLHGGTWLSAAWVRPARVAWSGPSLTTTSLLLPPGKAAAAVVIDSDHVDATRRRRGGTRGRDQPAGRPRVRSTGGIAHQLSRDGKASPGTAPAFRCGRLPPARSG